MVRLIDIGSEHVTDEPHKVDHEEVVPDSKSPFVNKLAELACVDKNNNVLKINITFFKFIIYSFLFILILIKPTEL